MQKDFIFALNCFQARNRTGNLGLTYDTLTSWYARQTDLPDDAAFFASINKNTSNGSGDYYASGYPCRRQSGFSVGSSSRHLLSRTPTTRSDPSEFKASQDDSYVRYYAVRSDGKVVPENKENWTLERKQELDQVLITAKVDRARYLVDRGYKTGKKFI